MEGHHNIMVKLNMLPGYRNSHYHQRHITQELVLPRERGETGLMTSLIHAIVV